MARKDANPGAKERTAERRLRVIEYRKAGMSVRKIAKMFGVSATTIAKDIQVTLAEVSKKTVENARELQSLNSERLEMAMMAIAERVTKGDLQAIAEWNKLIKTHSDLLGLCEAKKIAPTTPDGSESWPGVDRKRIAALKNLPVEKLALFEELMALLDQSITAPEEDEDEVEGE